MPLPMPTTEEAVAWAEEADKLAVALQDLLLIIEADNLIPESVSYMRHARNAVADWPDRFEVEEAKARIWQRMADSNHELNRVASNSKRSSEK